MKLIKLAIASSITTATLLATTFASASSHTEAPAIARDRAADNTDVYAWRCNSSGTPSLCIVANYDGLQLPEGGPNYGTFSTSALYTLHVTYNDEKGVPTLKDYVTIDVDFRAGAKNPGSAAFKRVEPDDKAAPPGGGKEFFAQLAGLFDINANVTMTKRAADGKSSRRTLFKNVPVAPPNAGTRTLHFAYGAPGSTYEEFSKKFIHSANNYQFFAGPRDDAFFVNLAQIFDLGAFVGLNDLNGAPFRSKLYDKPGSTGPFANTDPTKAPDAVAYTNVSSIAFRIPIAELMPDGQVPTAPSNAATVGVWASASRPAVAIFSVKDGRLGISTGSLADDGREYTGAWTQVSRQGLPLINEVVIGKQDQDFYNRTTPQNDVKNFGKYLLNPVLVRDVEAIGGYAQLGVASVPDDFKYGRTDILDVINLKNIPKALAHDVPIENGRTGDVLRVDLSGDSGFPNGRALSGPAVASGKEEDVTDVLLLLILGKLDAAFAGKITDYVGGPGDGRKLLPAFPYLATPFAGDSEGKGSPAKL
jgi:Domain of unknown function (DUF4331)